MKTPLKKIMKIALLLVFLLIITVIFYVGYLFLSYGRIEDQLALKHDDGAIATQMSIGEEYTVVTQNIGFGAYSKDFTFFMDGGKESRARSMEAVLSNTEGVLNQVQKLKPDLILFQEVDLDSTRSHHVDQYQLIREKFKGFDSVKAINYDSGYLFYPFREPHGKSLSSLATASRFHMEASLRRSLPVSTDYSKFFDLDRCYTITTIPVENGKKLQLYNVHLSAYGGSPEIRDGQMNMLMEDIAKDISQGNYVICGGDFNHDFTGDSSILMNKGEHDFGWAQPFPDEKIPDGLHKLTEYSSGQMIPTTRNTDIPYEKGVSFVVILDGFLVSSNVKWFEVENIDNGFEFTDHNPVKLKFMLQ